MPGDTKMFLAIAVFRENSQQSLGGLMARAGPSRRGDSRLEPARFGSYRKPMGVGGGCFRIYRPSSVRRLRIGRCDGRHRFTSIAHHFFWTPREFRIRANVAFKVQNFRIPLDRSNFGRRLTYRQYPELSSVGWAIRLETE